eukprot:TRINITY_DN1681_c0_g1_i1.p3 TRINITY_DN1681_c0_g1~~TRINITY_DN1681_c0_g1_i1.p3  ORF type:complete len:257 (+),score=20.39 TRINITY_DN1681_c0_g1_i1:119-889(+)
MFGPGIFFFFLMIRRPPRSTHCISSAASDVYKRQIYFFQYCIYQLFFYLVTDYSFTDILQQNPVYPAVYYLFITIYQIHQLPEVNSSNINWQLIGQKNILGSPDCLGAAQSPQITDQYGTIAANSYRLTVAVTLKACSCLKRMSDSMTKIKQHPKPFLPLILFHYSSFQQTGTPDYLGQDWIFSAQYIQIFFFQLAKKTAVQNKAVLNNFCQAGNIISLRQGLQGNCINNNTFRLIKVSYQIFPQRMVDSHLTAYT